MIEVSKEVGRYLKQTMPFQCVKTTHGRHYYAEDNPKVWKEIAKVPQKVIYTYPEKD